MYDVSLIDRTDEERFPVNGIPVALYLRSMGAGGSTIWALQRGAGTERARSADATGCWE